MNRLPANQSIVTWMEAFPKSAFDLNPPSFRVFLSGKDASGNWLYSKSQGKATILTVNQAFEAVMEVRRIYGGGFVTKQIDVLGYFPE